MPFVRFSRDRRGYEHTYLIHAAPRRGAPTRILYWYRTPPGIKVGREAFDVESRRMLESQYPAVPFDWPKLLETPMPPPDAENWRERRRVERSARQSRQQEELEDPAAEQVAPAEPVDAAPAPEIAVDADPGQGDPAGADSAGSDEAANSNRKRRRRGGRRRRRQGSPLDLERAVGAPSGADVDSPPIQATLASEMASGGFSPVLSDDRGTTGESD